MTKAQLLGQYVKDVKASTKTIPGGFNSIPLLTAVMYYGTYKESNKNRN